MSVTPEELAAYADGELSDADAARVAAAIEADPALGEQVAAHQALKERLSAHFAPIVEQPVPDRLNDLLITDTSSESSGVVDFAARREAKHARRRLPGWGWAGGAIAASLLVVLVIFGVDRTPSGYAATQVAAALDDQLVAEQGAQDEFRILLSFRNSEGEYCRAFSGAEAGGIACRDETGWRLELLGEGGDTQQGEFRQAGSVEELLAAAQAMAEGPALDSEAEAEARAASWR